MRMKSKLIAMMSGLTLAFTGVAGSYAYFTVEKTAGENKISMGKFPKAKVKVFASTGPLYSNAFGNGSNSSTGNYNTWLDLASQYVAHDMIGNNVGTVGNDKVKFENLPNGSAIDIKSNIGTFGNGNTSWQGSKENAENENGNMVHYVVAIFNEANKGEEAGRKLNYKNEHVKIERYDNFKGESGKSYKIRKEDNVSLNGKEERIRTFDWDGIKFVEDGEHGTPSEDADLIVFDVGATGYFANGSEQKDLNKLNNTLLGEESLFDENNNILWQSKNPLYNLASQMNGIDKKARLLNSFCNVSFKYTNESSYMVSDSYSINMTGSIIPIEEEKPNTEEEDNKENVDETTKPEDGWNPDAEENKKPGPETGVGPGTRPIIPGNNSNIVGPNGSGSNQKPGRPTRPSKPTIPETPNNNEANQKPENTEKPETNVEEENKKPTEETTNNNENEINKEELNKNNSSN